jgi:predicted O-methyltransferase YrrM
MLTNHEYPEQILSQAKKCALIAVDEILTSKATAYPNQEIENGQVFKEYWEEVKQKIKQL